VCSSFGRDIPGEKFFDAIDRMIGDARQEAGGLDAEAEMMVEVGREIYSRATVRK